MLYRIAGVRPAPLMRHGCSRALPNLCAGRNAVHGADNTSPTDCFDRNGLGRIPVMLTSTAQFGSRPKCLRLRILNLISEWRTAFESANNFVRIKTSVVLLASISAVRLLAHRDRNTFHEDCMV